MPIVRFDEVTCLADWAAGQRQARTAGRAGAGQCAAGGGEGMGRSEPWGLVRGAPWGWCVGRLASTCRPVHSEPQLPHLQAGALSVCPGWRSSARGGRVCPRACLQGLRVWTPAAGGGPSPRRPRVLLWTWGDGSTLRPHQGMGAPPGVGGPTRGRWPCRHRRRPRDTPSSLALPRGRAGQASGEDGPRGGGGRHDLSPLASVSPPVQWGAAGSPFTRSVGGFEVRMPDSDGVLASGARPAAEEAAVWGGPVLAEGSHWC